MMKLFKRVHNLQQRCVVKGVEEERKGEETTKRHACKHNLNPLHRMFHSMYTCIVICAMNHRS